MFAVQRQIGFGSMCIMCWWPRVFGQFFLAFFRFWEISQLEAPCFPLGKWFKHLNRIRIRPLSSKIVRKNFISTVLWLFMTFYHWRTMYIEHNIWTGKCIFKKYRWGISKKNWSSHYWYEKQEEDLKISKTQKLKAQSISWQRPFNWCWVWTHLPTGMAK